MGFGNGAGPDTRGGSHVETFDGLRLEAVGAGQATMADIFGVASNEQAQAMSDR